MQFIVHEDPVGRTATNYIARADLAPFGLDGQVEQLWLKAVNDGSYEVACIPFSVYGLALGDTVLLNEHDYVSEIVKTSWHRTLRLLFIPGLPPAQLRQAAEAIRAEVNAAGLLSDGTVIASSPSTCRRTQSPHACSPSWRLQSIPAMPPGNGLM